MAGFTIYDALLGELEPYSPNSLTLKKALKDAGIDDSNVEYARDTHYNLVIRAAINVLRKLIVLASDSLGKSSQSYKVEQLEKRLCQLCDEIGLDSSLYVDLPTIEDGSHLW